MPYFAARQRLDVNRWQQFADFALKFGLIDKAVDVSNLLWEAEN